MKRLLLFLLLPSFAIAQQPLSVGDHLPPEIFASLTSSQTINQKLKTKNQLILLDFFATWCTGCVRELPKLDSLQKKFNGRFNVLLVTYQTKQEVDAFRKKNKLFAKCTLPIITGDTIVKKLFPHIFIPHEVWINETGKVVAITDAFKVNQENIEAFLNGRQPSLAVKIDAMDFDRKRPLLQNNNGVTENDVLFRSLLTTQLPGMGTSEGTDHSTTTTRYFLINSTILHLYRKALNFEPNRFVLEVADTTKYLVPAEPSDEWKQKHLFCYEITLPARASKQTIQQYLLNDLNRYFSLYGRIEKRKIECWVLNRINNHDSSLKTSQVEPGIKVNDSTGELLFSNQPFKKVIANLNSYRTMSVNKPIFIDETGIHFNVDILIPADANSNIELLKRYLLKVGLTLTHAGRTIDMFVLTELRSPGLTNNN